MLPWLRSNSATFAQNQCKIASVMQVNVNSQFYFNPGHPPLFEKIHNHIRHFNHSSVGLRPCLGPYAIFKILPTTSMHELADEYEISSMRFKLPSIQAEQETADAHQRFRQKCSLLKKPRLNIMPRLY